MNTRRQPPPRHAGPCESLECLLACSIPVEVPPSLPQFSSRKMLWAVAALAVALTFYAAVRDLGQNNAVWNRLARGQDLGRFVDITVENYRGVLFHTDQEQLLDELRGAFLKCRERRGRTPKMQLGTTYRFTIRLSNGRVARGSARLGVEGLVVYGKRRGSSDEDPSFWARHPLPTWKDFDAIPQRAPSDAWRR